MTAIDHFDIVQSRYEQDRDYAKLQGEGLDWFSKYRVRLPTYQEPARDLNPVLTVVFKLILL